MRFPTHYFFGGFFKDGAFKVLRLSAIAVIGCLFMAQPGFAQKPTQITITPPSNLPASTPAGYQLIVPVVGQQESEWCWAASGQMVFEYDDPLPAVLQCQEANAAFNRSDCCTNSGSSQCDQGDGGPTSEYPFDSFSSPPNMPMTWDQLRYQIWVVNHPFLFGWNWVGGGAHIQVVTGYSTDAAGDKYVWVNNPEPVGQGDTEVMTYDEWVSDPTNSPFGNHTHEGDWFDYTYNKTRLIYNLATNSAPPTTGLTDAQAPNLTATVVSDRIVPFTISAIGLSISGTIQERVAREDASQTLDFYYRIISSPSSKGAITDLKISGFGRFAVAAAYRPDSLGTEPTAYATRDISGDNISITLQNPIPAGGSSHFILLMTNATTSNDSGVLSIGGRSTQMPLITWTTPFATDQPTG